MRSIEVIHLVNIRDLDLNLVRALEVLLVERSVGRAASRLGLSQPAMSHALKRLRTALKDPLLVRVGSEMDLTPRAQSLREPVAQALAAARRLLEPALFDAATSHRRFTTMMPDVAASLIPPTLTGLIPPAAPN